MLSLLYLFIFYFLIDSFVCLGICTHEHRGAHLCAHEGNREKHRCPSVPPCLMILQLTPLAYADRHQAPTVLSPHTLVL